MQPIKKLTDVTPDVHGIVPDQSLVNTRWMHSGNGKVYRITGFCWLGATDEWGFRMFAIGDGGTVCIVRPMSHLEGNRANGEKRYERVR